MEKLLAREDSVDARALRVCPVWYDVTREQAEAYIPLVAGIRAINSNVGSDEPCGQVRSAS
jgi:hypothetical protein